MVRIQNTVDNSPEADIYYTDGYLGYIDVVYPGKHIRNIRDKKDTHNVESINADLRHYIPVLARRNRCFARKSKRFMMLLLYLLTLIIVLVWQNLNIGSVNIMVNCLSLLLIFFNNAIGHT